MIKIATFFILYQVDFEIDRTIITCLNYWSEISVTNVKMSQNIETLRSKNYHLKKCLSYFSCENLDCVYFIKYIFEQEGNYFPFINNYIKMDNSKTWISFLDLRNEF